MSRRVLLLALPVCLLAISTLADSPLFAQSGFDKFRQRMDDIRPRGKLLRKVFGQEEPESEEKEEDARKDGGKDQPQPTPADARTRTDALRKPTPATRPPSPSMRAPATGTSPKYRVPEPPSRDLTSPGSTRPTPGTSFPARKPAVNSGSGLGIVTRKTSRGMQVVSVRKESPAARAGMRIGDVVLEIAGLKIESDEDTRGIFEALNEGDQVEAIVERNGDKETLLLQFGEAVAPSTNEDASARATAPTPPVGKRPQLSAAFGSSAAPLGNAPLTDTVSTDTVSTDTVSTDTVSTDTVAGAAPASELESLRSTVRRQRQTILELQRRLQQTQQRPAYRGGR